MASALGASSAGQMYWGCDRQRRVLGGIINWGRAVGRPLWQVTLTRGLRAEKETHTEHREMGPPAGTCGLQRPRVLSGPDQRSPVQPARPRAGLGGGGWGGGVGQGSPESARGAGRDTAGDKANGGGAGRTKEPEREEIRNPRCLWDHWGRTRNPRWPGPTGTTCSSQEPRLIRTRHPQTRLEGCCTGREQVRGPGPRGGLPHGGGAERRGEGWGSSRPRPPAARIPAASGQMCGRRP